MTKTPDPGSIQARLIERAKAYERLGRMEDNEYPEPDDFCGAAGGDAARNTAKLLREAAAALSPQPDRLEILTEYARADAHEIHRLLGKATAFEQALRRIVALDLGKVQGKDDFYTGPDRFFQAHQIARHVLATVGEGEAAALDASPRCPHDCRPCQLKDQLAASERAILAHEAKRESSVPLDPTKGCANCDGGYDEMPHNPPCPLAAPPPPQRWQPDVLVKLQGLVTQWREAKEACGARNAWDREEVYESCADELAALIPSPPSETPREDP